MCKLFGRLTQELNVFGGKSLVDQSVVGEMSQISLREWKNLIMTQESTPASEQISLSSKKHGEWNLS